MFALPRIAPGGAHRQVPVVPYVPDSIPETLGLVAALATTLLCARAIGLPLSASLGAGEALAFAIIGNVTFPLAVTLAAVALSVRTAAGTPTPGARSFLREASLLLAGLAAYTFLRRLIESDAAVALQHGRDIIALERALSLYVEPDIQDQILRSDALMRTLNWFYSFGFLAWIAASLIWLWATDRRAYRFLRNSLGLSVLPALAVIALYPVAPPRLIAEAGVIDTVVLYGREHAFANEYAAVPSLHVGWMVVAGIAVAMPMRSALRWVTATMPGALMLATVLATGNHFWVDGIVGTAFALAYAAATRPGRLTMRAALRLVALTLRAAAVPPRVVLSVGGVGGLLGYLIVMQVTQPGFTDFWWYLTAQIVVIGTLLLGAEMLFRGQGGLSATTHVFAVVCCYADVLGTDGNLYANIDEYDKLTHFAGVAAITAGLYDGLRAMHHRGWLRWAPGERLSAAVLAGFATGVSWEVYEFLGDTVFHTTRVQSTWDTSNDILSDALGAIALGTLLWMGELSATRRTVEAMEREVRETPGGFPP